MNIFALVVSLFVIGEGRNMLFFRSWEHGRVEDWGEGEGMWLEGFDYFND